MRRTRRSLAVISALLFQLMLVVGAYGCTVLDGAPGGAASMAGMSMPGTDRAAPPSSPVGGHKLPCQLPANGCQSMAPCTIATVVVASSEHMLSRAPSHGVIPTLEMLVPPSATLTPELPPPRA